VTHSSYGGGGRKPEGYIEIKSPQSSTWLKLGAGKGGLVYLRTCPGVLKQPVQFLLSTFRKLGVQTMTRTFVFKPNWWLIFRSHVKRLAGPPCLVAVSLPGFERCTCFDYDNDMRCTGELVVANGDYCTSFMICVVLLLIALSRHPNHDGYSTTVRCRDNTLITAAAWNLSKLRCVVLF
jgi:hypothetical protein